MTAVWLNPGIGEAIVRGEKQFDSKSLKVYEVAVPNRRKWTSHFCIGLRRLLVRALNLPLLSSSWKCLRSVFSSILSCSALSA
jgi:hypothetical protein